MKKFIPLLFLFLLPAATGVHAQQYIFAGNLGSFRNAVSFCLSADGYLYVVDAGTSEVLRVDTLGAITHSAGGYGWGSGAFNSPVSVTMIGTAVYVADRDAHRVLQFDRLLNYAGAFNGKMAYSDGEGFRKPLSVITNSQGDIYILDGESQRVAKFTMRGSFSTYFGGFDAGEFGIRRPVCAAGINSSILVLDDEQLLLFDPFGTGIAKTANGHNLHAVNGNYGTYTGVNKDSVFFISTQQNTIAVSPAELIGILDHEGFAGAIADGDRLFVLTPIEVLLYRKHSGQ